MASAPPSPHHPTLPDDDDDAADFLHDFDADEDDDWEMSKRMSRLSVEGSEGGDADAEPSDGDNDGVFDADDNIAAYEDYSGIWGEVALGGGGGGDVDLDAAAARAKAPSASLPGTPERGGAPAPAAWPKEYASETEARWLLGGGGGGRRVSGGGGGGGRRHRRHEQRRMRELWLERAWQMKKSWHERQERGGAAAAAEGHVVVVVGRGSPSAGAGGVAMDMEEVRACKDLGLELPGDWTVEVPSYALSGVDTASSGGNSPASGSWRISSPGDDPKDVKARLKVWAQAVALASASRFGS